MYEDLREINVIEFAGFSIDYPEIWTIVLGATVFHKIWGEGKIIRVQQRTDYIPLIHVSFGKGKKEEIFNPESFKEGIFESWEISNDQFSNLQTWKKEFKNPKKTHRIKKNKLDLNIFYNFGINSLWHISHQENILSICNDGLLSNRIAYDSGYVSVDISDREAQRWRERKDPFFKRPIHEYVPLYINPRNAMLYKRRNIQQELCIIEIDPFVLNEIQFLFTDGNAASRKTRFFNNLKDLKKLDWSVLKSKSWTDREDGKRKMCSEVLVYKKISSIYFKKIHCYSKKTFDLIKNCNKPLGITQNIFF